MSHQIKFDGLYRSPTIIDPDDGERYWRYLRFRADGSVTFGAYTGSEEDVPTRWFDRDKRLAQGRFSLKGEKIAFWVKAAEDRLKTRFEGTIRQNSLFVHMWNSDGDVDITELYTFQQVNIDSPYQPYVAPSQ